MTPLDIRETPLLPLAENNGWGGKRCWLGSSQGTGIGLSGDRSGYSSASDHQLDVVVLEPLRSAPVPLSGGQLDHRPGEGEPPGKVLPRHSALEGQPRDRAAAAPWRRSPSATYVRARSP